jgi:hypothetical protein
VFVTGNHKEIEKRRSSWEGYGKNGTLGWVKVNS